MRTRAAAFAAAIIGFLPVAPAAAASLLIVNARVIDGTGAPARTDLAILVRDGRIAEIAPRIEAAGIPVLDVRGATVVPGLVDAHVHLMSVPGSEMRRDNAGRIERLRRRHLCSYLACGVTTVLDTAIRPEVAREIRAWLAAGHPGPRYLTLGPALAARGGYMARLFPETTVSSADELDAAFDTIAAVGVVGVKVPIERGFGFDAWPIHSPAMREAIVRKAAERRLPIFVHASDEVEQTIGLDMGAYALVHTNFAGKEPSAAFVERAARAKTYMMTTFSIIDAGLTRWHPERLDDPMVRIAVPAVERRTARDARRWRAVAEEDVGFVLPWLPHFLRRPVAWVATREGPLRRVLEANQRAARRLHDAGVPVVIGSDAGNSVGVLSQFHGTSTLRELELLAGAGVSPGDVLAAATRLPARLLGLDAEIGTIEVGKAGDLVVLRDDPERGVGAFRTVEWTIQGGMAHTPSEWARCR